MNNYAIAYDAPDIFNPQVYLTHARTKAQAIKYFEQEVNLSKTMKIIDIYVYDNSGYYT